MDRSALITMGITTTLALTLLMACGEKDEEGDGCSATVAEVCAAVFDCGGWGWPDEATCEEHFINSEDTAWSTDCADEAGYLSCMCDVVSLTDCNEFSDSEWPCWEDNCY